MLARTCDPGERGIPSPLLRSDRAFLRPAASSFFCRSESFCFSRVSFSFWGFTAVLRTFRELPLVECLDSSSSSEAGCDGDGLPLASGEADEVRIRLALLDCLD